MYNILVKDISQLSVSARVYNFLKSPKKQIGGSHYKDNFTIQPIEYIQANRMEFAEGCVVKYVSRHSFKNGKEDILKAIQNLEFILERDYND